MDKLIEINLIPAQNRPQGGNGWKQAAWAMLPIGLLAAGLPVLLQGQRSNNLQSQIEQVDSKMLALAPQQDEYRKLKDQQATMQANMEVARALLESKRYWSNDLAAFAGQMQESGGVQLTMLNMLPLSTENLESLQQSGIYVDRNVSRQLALTASARSQQAISDFVKKYEQSQEFGINFRGMTRDEKSGSYTFNADIGVSEPEKAPGEGPEASAKGGTGSAIKGVKAAQEAAGGNK